MANKKYYSKEMNRKFFKAIKDLQLDDLFLDFEEIFSDLGFKRLDKDQALKKQLEALEKYLYEFKKKAINTWKLYNSYSKKGL